MVHCEVRIVPSHGNKSVGDGCPRSTICIHCFRFFPIPNTVQFISCDIGRYSIHGQPEPRRLLREDFYFFHHHVLQFEEPRAVYAGIFRCWSSLIDQMNHFWYGSMRSGDPRCKNYKRHNSCRSYMPFLSATPTVKYNVFNLPRTWVGLSSLDSIISTI